MVFYFTEGYQFIKVQLEKHSNSFVKSHLSVDSLNDARDNMENLHLSVTLCHLLQKLEEKPKDGLQVLKQRQKMQDWLWQTNKISFIY